MQTKPKLTFDEFFDYTTFSLFNFSPSGQYLLFQDSRPAWNTSSYTNQLWIYDTVQQTKRLITNIPGFSFAPQWSPTGRYIALSLEEVAANTIKTNHYRRSSGDSLPEEKRIYLYSLVSNSLLPISIGTDSLRALTWSNDDSTLYLSTTVARSNHEDEEEWKDVIQYRENEKYDRSVIHRIKINMNSSSPSAEKEVVLNLPFRIGALLYASGSEKLVFTSLSSIVEDLGNFELYSFDPRNPSSITKLTNNEAFENGLQISQDGRNVLFVANAQRLDTETYNRTKFRLYSVNLMNGQTTELAKDFPGTISDFTTRSDGGIYIAGQVGTEVQIYLQRSPSDKMIPLTGWHGKYEGVILSDRDALAFIHSSTEKPMEVYIASSIEQLQSAKAITEDNKLFTERNLPRTKVYRWQNEDDQQIIEGILHYPPGKFDAKNLPLLVLVHGGPYTARVNQLLLDWYTCAPLLASEGWLVLEPNYRGSSGYGARFGNEISTRPLTLPGKDILYGVDQLVRDGNADPNRMAISGYSYGGILTNWLITQTKRFSAALSGGGISDHVSGWGTMDRPVIISSLFGGYPWEVPHIYQNEAPMYQLDRVRTPTLLTTGEDDARVPISQSYMLERGLHYRGVPVKLLIFPKEGHDLLGNPWHGKIKVREELKWLEKYVLRR